MTEPINDMDWQLANYIISYEMLPRQEIQKLLRALVNLHKLGVKYSLDKLLIESNLMSTKMVHAVVDQCHRQHLVQTLGPQEAIRIAKKKGNKQIKIYREF